MHHSGLRQKDNDMNKQKFYYTRYLQCCQLQALPPTKQSDRDYPYTRLPPRRCLLEPIPQIYLAQDLLSEAAECDKRDDRNGAEEAIRKADFPEIEKWTESLWGKAIPPSTLRRLVEDPQPIPKERQDKKDVPAEMSRNLVARDGYHCRWCGIPVIPKRVRDYLKGKYGEPMRWVNSGYVEHAAFKAMTLVEDHLIPRSRDGKTLLNNLIVSCWPCNSGRGNFMPEEMCLIRPIPAEGPWIKSNWDGLKRVLSKG